MKKIILLAVLALTGIATAQQIKVVRPGGAELLDGATFTTNSASDETTGPNRMRFKITNLTDEEMIVGAKVLGFTDNVDGTEVQFCFGVCLYELSPGIIIPNEPLAGGATTTADDDHFQNYNVGTGGPVTYHLAFVKLDYDSDNDVYTEVEELFDFYYTYDATAGVTSFDGLKELGLSIEGTIVKSSLNVNASQSASLQLFDTTGKLVKTTAIKSGSQAIELSALSAGIYMAKFTTADNKTATVKIVKN
jgi:hypothetical protein